MIYTYPSHHRHRFLLAGQVLLPSGRHARNRILLFQLHAGCHLLNEAHVGVGTEHGVVALFSVDQLQLIKLHIFSGLLDRVLLRKHLVLKRLNQFQVLGSGRSLIVELSDLSKSAIQELVLLVHHTGRILELVLKLRYLLRLLGDQLLHRLAKSVLQSCLLLAELSLHLPSPGFMLCFRLLHLCDRLFYLTLHFTDLSFFSFYDGVQPSDFPFEFLDFAS